MTATESNPAESNKSEQPSMIGRHDDVTVFSSDSASTTIFGSAREAWKFRSFISYMTKRELRTTYLRSYLGWIWSLINPIAEVAIYSLVFGVLLGISRDIPVGPGGFQSFPHFLMAAIAVWGFFRMVSGKVLSNFMATVRLRRKLYFPPVAAALSTAMSTMVEASLLVVVVTLFFAVWGHISIHAVLILPAALFAGMSGLGVGLALSVANSKYRDISYIYTIGLRLAFYLLPIIWPLQSIEGRFSESTQFLRPFIVNNPFAQLIEFGRFGLYYQQWPTLGHWIYLASFSLAVLFVGWMIFARSSADVAEGLG